MKKAYTSQNLKKQRMTQIQALSKLTVLVLKWLCCSNTPNKITNKQTKLYIYIYYVSIIFLNLFLKCIFYFHFQNNLYTFISLHTVKFMSNSDPTLCIQWGQLYVSFIQFCSFLIDLVLFAHIFQNQLCDIRTSHKWRLKAIRFVLFYFTFFLLLKIDSQTF